MSLQKQVHPILTILSDTASKLSELSPVQKKQEIEIIVSYDMYKDVLAELSNYSLFKPTATVGILSANGFKFNVSCKEMKDAEISNKLSKCFDYLTKDIDIKL